MARKRIACETLSRHVLYDVPGRMGGWPSILRSRSGALAVVFSGSRQFHVDPFGQTLLVTSRDDGSTWSAPRVINDTPLDDRDPGLVETDAGSWVLSFFTSRAFADWWKEARRRYGDAAVASWQPYVERLTPELEAACLGSFVRRSKDRGTTWGELIRVPVSAPHGPVPGRDGRLLYLGLGRRAEGAPLEVGLCASEDDGCTWSWQASVCPYDLYEGLHFTEPHLLELPDGRLLGMLRVNAARPGRRLLYQTESSDGGRTWSRPRSTGIWGLPPHLLRHSSGVLVCAYGHRREPYGQRACLSRDGGRSWPQQVVLAHADAGRQRSADVAPAGRSGPDYYYQVPDLGYPASAELPDGSILTVYYESFPDRPGAAVRAVRWRLPE